MLVTMTYATSECERRLAAVGTSSNAVKPGDKIAAWPSRFRRRGSDELLLRASDRTAQR